MASLATAGGLSVVNDQETGLVIAVPAMFARLRAVHRWWRRPGRFWGQGDGVGGGVVTTVAATVLPCRS
jgi:hypothetical protein